MSRLTAHLEHRQIAYRLAAAALVFATSLVIGYYSYRDVVFTTDENSYLFQSSTFADLALSRTPPPHPLEQLLDGGMNVIDSHRGWFSRYPPGHALWLLPGILVGAPRLMSALAAALSMWWLTGAARTLRAPWWAAAIFLLLSPYFLYMHGTLLTHPGGMMAVSLMLWAYLLWRDGRGSRYVAIAGAAWAFLYLARPYTAALLVPAFGLDGAGIWLRRRDRKTFIALVWFALAALIGPLLSLWYNKAVTGDFLQTPYLLYEPAAALGFHEASGHTLEIGLRHLQRNLGLLDAWLLGTPWALAAAALCFIACASTSLAWLAGIATVSVIVGYVSFYYRGFNTCGPYYYFETLPFLVLIWLLFVQRAQRWRHAAWANLGLCLLWIFAASSSLAFTWQHAAKFRNRTGQEAALKAAIRSAPPGSIVALVDENYNRGDDLRTRLRHNPRGLDSDPLVIESLESNDFIIASIFPGRQLFQLRNTNKPRLEPYPDIRPPYAEHIPGSHTHGEVGEGNRSPDERTWCRTVSPDAGPGFLAFGRFRIAPAGRIVAVYDLTVSNVPTDKPLLMTIHGSEGHQELARQEFSGNPGRTRLEVPFDLPYATGVEPRLFYGGAGEVSFWSISLEEAPASLPD